MAFAIWLLQWPADARHAKQVFEAQWTLLRSLLLHYLRPNTSRCGQAATERARRWGQQYGALCESVCPPYTTACEPLLYHRTQAHMTAFNICVLFILLCTCCPYSRWMSKTIVSDTHHQGLATVTYTAVAQVPLHTLFCLRAAWHDGPMHFQATPHRASPARSGAHVRAHVRSEGVLGRATGPGGEENHL